MNYVMLVSRQGKSFCLTCLSLRRLTIRKHHQAKSVSRSGSRHSRQKQKQRSSRMSRSWCLLDERECATCLNIKVLLSPSCRYQTLNTSCFSSNRHQSHLSTLRFPVLYYLNLKHGQRTHHARNRPSLRRGPRSVLWKRLRTGPDFQLSKGLCCMFSLHLLLGERLMKNCADSG
jgi:hypothetical protein